MNAILAKIAKVLRLAAEFLDSVADAIEPIRPIEPSPAPDVVEPEKPTES